MPPVARKKLSPEQLEHWWKQFRKTADEESRNQLLEYYLPLVKYTAERVYTKLPEEVDVDDLISAGIFGLMDALTAFDEGRGVKFETYCSPRIRGAILDELRSMDWVPRLVRSRAHKLNLASRELEAQLGRSPTNSELAKRMKLSMSEFEKVKRDAATVGQVSLSRKWFETDSSKDVREIDVLEDKRSDDPLHVAQGKDIKDLLTRGLSRAERLIIVLYYYEEMTMKEIGQTLDLSESRVSQMHSAVLERLKSQLDKRRKELQPA
ncbi:MAG: FliA/WhiG family RNA polymerase sigma factor [Planctomycetaceae bacterium]|nr:FliA/WhiG family RNA polymerase sigma factor [Planctomycetaceae bacterium]